jgi:DNA-binding Lrp family transcriptional regulator
MSMSMRMRLEDNGPMITAIVLIHTERGQTAAAAEALAEIPDVAEVYSVSGNFDLVAIVRVHEYEQMADVVPRRIAAVKGIADTNTLMAFQYYSRHDLERMWGIGLDTDASSV